MNAMSQIRASRDGTELSFDDLYRYAPSIFASAPHDSRSDRYSLIPTADVVKGLSREGFFPVAAKQAGTRDASRTNFAKHMIRFRRRGDVYQDVGNVIPELVLVNSHDGSSSYQLMAGLFRLVCLNGMVVADQEIASIRIPHKGDIVGQVVDAAYTVIDQTEGSLETAREWSSVKLSNPERQVLANAAHVLRFADADGNVNTPIEPDQLLTRRRYGDDAQDLWTTWNVVQENVMRGGLRGVARTSRGWQRRVSTREVRGIDQDVKLNKALWTLGSQMAALKTGNAAA